MTIRRASVQVLLRPEMECQGQAWQFDASWPLKTEGFWRLDLQQQEAFCPGLRYPSSSTAAANAAIASKEPVCLTKHVVEEGNLIYAKTQFHIVRAVFGNGLASWNFFDPSSRSESLIGVANVRPCSWIWLEKISFCLAGLPDWSRAGQRAHGSCYWARPELLHFTYIHKKTMLNSPARPRYVLWSYIRIHCPLLSLLRLLRQWQHHPAGLEVDEHHLHDEVPHEGLLMNEFCGDRVFSMDAPLNGDAIPP